ncbi:MAG: DUF2088 domain-containing protein [Anaerolineae bacterium]|nr:DUF2088 domain-containing protein [Anaerolineae bacterium]
MMTSLYLTKIRQRFPRPRLNDARAAMTQELDTMRPLIQPGDSIAIAVGSRGIANIATIVKTVVDFVKAQSAAPFIIPAMGSHGGGTAEGQAGVLASYGITGATMGAPVRSSLDVVEIPAPGFPNRVFMDRYAYESDGVILINRVKVHTDFHGPYESGLVKMSVIGLGKHRQALEIHSFGVYGLRERIPPTAQRIFETGKVLFGVALVENAYDETMVVKALRAGDIMREEPSLLDVARANMPRLPVDNLDILIIDRMGKDISGAGIDPNIIGRNRIRGEPEPDHPHIKAVTVHDLTDATHGNACGTGLADVVTRRLFDKTDLTITNENIVTSSFLERGNIPVIAPTDAQAYTWALRSCSSPAGSVVPVEACVARIRDTLHLSELYVSRAVLDEIVGRVDIEVLGEPVTMFSTDGVLVNGEW